MSSQEGFKAAQAISWNDAALAWKKWWTVFEEGGAKTLSDRLVELSNVKPGDSVLDIATGVGEQAITAARRVKPDGKVTAIDISSEMLTIAAARGRQYGLKNLIRFETSDAETYSYPVSSFNAILSRWGLMFLPALVPTLQKIRESLIPDGIFAAAVWSNPEKVPVLSLAQKTAAKQVGLSPPAAGSPGSFRLADMASLENSFNKAELRNVRSERRVITFRFRSVGEFVDFHKAINVPVATMLKNQPINKQKEVWRSINQSVEPFVDDAGAVTLDNEVICITGQR